MSLLKAMKFVDEGGKPTARYHSFLDDTQWKKVLAEGVRDAYPDLFRINRNAQTMTREQVTGKVKSLTEGKASEAVLGNTVETFVELVKLADFSSGHLSDTESKAADKSADDKGGESEPADGGKGAASSPAALSTDGTPPLQRESVSTPSLVYRIEIVLPAVRDQAVYDAIFQSVRTHLLR